MSDYTVYNSERELRENLSDLDDLLADYDKSQETLEEQRGVLADQVQGALAIYEKQVSEYEQKRDDLEHRQKELAQSRAEALENRDRLQQQVDAKQDAKLGKPDPELGKKADDEAGLKATGRERGTGQADGINHTTGPTTREQIHNLKAQLSKPQPALNLDPPGMGDSQATTIDRDLKLMAKIKEKEQKMDGASKKIQDDWKRSNGPKP